MDENEMRQTKNGIYLLGNMLDLIENGDCIEDFELSNTMCHAISTMKVLLHAWIEGLEWRLDVAEYGLSEALENTIWIKRGRTEEE